MTVSDRVVFDCNVYFQAIISPLGRAGQLFALAAAQRINLFISAYVLEELRELTEELRIRSKYKLTQEILDEFFDSISAAATFIDSVPSVFTFPRDPDDAHYVDLAVAASAKLIVSRDKDLLSLADETTPEGQDFKARFPEIAILTPPALLQMLDEHLAP